MKRLIFLKVEYRKRPDDVFKQFRSVIKDWKDVKFIKEIPSEGAIIIEFPDDKLQEVYENCVKLDIVAIFDSILPEGEE